MAALRIAAAVVALAAAVALPSPSSQNTTGIPWSSVRIGGGGYVTGVYAHPTTPVLYFGTDVGGAYRRSVPSVPVPGGIEWIPLLDAFTSDLSQYFSVSHMALDPVNGTTLTALLGGTLGWGACRVMRSEDAGDTWTVLIAGSGNWSLECGGNEGDRGMGDRLVVHPADGATFAIAGYDGRVYVTRDGFASGAAGVANISLPGISYPSAHPVRTLGFVPLAPAASAAPPVYALLAAVPSVGIFWSAGPAYEDPSTWAPVPAAAAAVLGNVSRFLAVPAAPAVLASFEGGFARLLPGGTPGSPTLSVDWSFNPDSRTYDGLAYDPTNPLDITFLAIEYDSNATFRRTLDGGKTWFVVNWTTYSTVPWARDNTYGLKLNAASTLTYDPFPNSAGAPLDVWVSDFFGVWRCQNWDAPALAAKAGQDPASAQVLFSNVEWGHEEVCVNFVKEPVANLTLSGVADDFGWLHDQGLDMYPSAIFPSKDDHNCAFGSDSTLTLAPGVTPPVPAAIWLTAGDEYGATRNGWSGLHHYVGVSNDGGKTFTETTYDAQIQGSNSYPYRVVAHPFNATVAAITGYQGMPVVHTLDGGNTWLNATDAATNLPIPSVGPYGNFWWAQPFARDNNADPTGSPSTPATLYYYNGTTSLFTSTDNGATWAAQTHALPPWNVPLFGIATPPRGTSAAGDIWAFAGWQLHHSTDGGKTFSGVWKFYSVKNTIAVGPLPATITSPRSGRTAAELSGLCARHRGAAARPAPRSLVDNDRAAGRTVPYPTSADDTASAEGSPAYVVYGVGTLTGDTDRVGVYVSADYGNTWGELTSARQGLGDSPCVLEASIGTPGRVYVGTDGRGAFYGDATPVIADMLLECEREAEGW
jgi:xyloglucan-specific exo-beta-1,4-glucanase